MSLPIITIVTVTYNAVQWLERCVESVVMQKRVGFEIEHLIVDGVSTDGTVELIEHLFAEGKVSRFVSEKDAGIYDAMNKGIVLASGSIIAFLNADDCYLPDAVQMLATPIISRVADYTFSDAWLVNENMIIQGERSAAVPYIFVVSAYCHQTLFCRTDLLRKEGGFDLHYKIIADADFEAKLVRRKVPYQYVRGKYVNFQEGGMSDQFLGREIVELYSLNLQNNLLSVVGESDLRSHLYDLKEYLLQYSIIAQQQNEDCEVMRYTSQLFMSYCMEISEQVSTEYAGYFLDIARYFGALSQDRKYNENYWIKWRGRVDIIIPNSHRAVNGILDEWSNKGLVLSYVERKEYFRIVRRIARRSNFYWEEDRVRLAHCFQQWGTPILTRILFWHLSQGDVLAYWQYLLVKVVTYYYLWQFGRGVDRKV